MVYPSRVLGEVQYGWIRFKEDCVTNSSTVIVCPVCCNHFSHEVDRGDKNARVFGYGLDFRLVPTDCNLVSELALCPNCHYVCPPDDFDCRVPGHVKDLVRSRKYLKIFDDCSSDHTAPRSWHALVSILEVKGLNPRTLGLTSLKGSWLARELKCLESEDELLAKADFYLDDALRRGLTKGNPGLIMYLLGEINRRRREFLRAREMLTFQGNNPRYRYPALLLTVLIEEEDSTPYWSLHAPDQMEQQSPRFKGLFPPLRSIPAGKTEFSATELSEVADQPDEDDSRLY